MAARTQTLLQLRTRIRKLADCVGDTTTGRHTNSEINTLINAKWQAMREKVCQAGARLYLTPATGTMTVGALAGYSFGTIPFPASAAAVYSIDVTVSANDIRTIHPEEFVKRNEFFGAFGQTNGIPVGFDVYNIGTESAGSVTAGSIAIFPPPDQAYAYAVWHLPSWTDLTNDAHVFNGLAGWDDWVVYGCVLDLAMPDNDMAGTAAAAVAAMAEAESRLISGANHVQRAGPIRRVDVAGMRRRDAFDSFMRHPR